MRLKSLFAEADFSMVVFVQAMPMAALDFVVVC
jgi:hypothetical protein